MRKSNFSNRSLSAAARHSQRGVSIIQALLVLVIGGIILVTGLNQFLSGERTANLQKNIGDVTEIVSGAKANYGQFAYVGLTTPIAIGASVIPDRLRTAPGAVTAAIPEWGGAITVADNNATTVGTATLSIAAVPSAICTQLVAGTHQIARAVTVGGVFVKPLDGQVDIAALNAQCTAGAAATVIWTFGR